MSAGQQERLTATQQLLFDQQWAELLCLYQLCHLHQAVSRQGNVWCSSDGWQIEHHTAQPDSTALYNILVR